MRVPTAFFYIIAFTALVGCTQPKSTTGIGSAAGGALGAGLGAIIGSQSGSAGSGLAIGAVAGAAGGALIGNAFQAQEEATRSQDEALERQARIMAAQRQEISELRRVKSDSYEKNIERYRQHPNPTHTHLSSQKNLHSQTVKTLPNSRMPTPHSSTADKVIERDLTVESSPRARWQEPTGKKLIPVNQEIPESPPAPSVEQKLEEVIPETKLTTQQEAPHSGCSDAEEERALAKSSLGSSEKLFHLRRALRLCPDKAELHHELGLVYLSMKRNTDAEFEFSQALKLNPKLVPAKKSLSKLTQREKF